MMEPSRALERPLTSLLARLQAAVADDYSVACEIGRGGMATVYLGDRSEEHTSELQSQSNLVCRLLLEKKKIGFRIELVLLLAERGQGTVPVSVTVPCV